MLSAEAKQRNQALKYATKELETITKTVSILNDLVPDKIYRIVYLKCYRFVDRYKRANSILYGTPTEYNSTGVILRVLAAEHGNHLQDVVSVAYDDIVCWEEWVNRDNPQLEAPLLVNFECIFPEMKKKCFNIE